MSKITGRLYRKNDKIFFPDEDGSLVKGTFLSYMRRGMCMVADTLGAKYEAHVEQLESAKGKDVNWRFRYYEDLSKLAIYKELKSIFVAGTGGLGKSYTVQQVLLAEEFVEDKDYVYIKGHASAYALFRLLEEHHNKAIIFDDADGILKDATALNILKAVIDSYSKRTVKWLTSEGGSRSVEKSFNFTGSVIFLSNLPFEKIPQPIMSRTIMVDVSMTPNEKMDRIRHIVKTMPELDSWTKEDKEQLITFLDKYKNVVEDFNLRSLVKAAQVYEKTKDWDYVRESILAS